MLTMIGEVAIELVFVAAVVVVVSCLAYLLTLTVREHRVPRAPVVNERESGLAERATPRRPAATGPRPSVTRHHAAPSS